MSDAPKSATANPSLSLYKPWDNTPMIFGDTFTCFGNVRGLEKGLSLRAHLVSGVGDPVSGEPIPQKKLPVEVTEDKGQPTPLFDWGFYFTGLEQYFSPWTPTTLTVSLIQDSDQSVLTCVESQVCWNQSIMLTKEKPRLTFASTLMIYYPQPNAVVPTFFASSGFLSLANQPVYSFVYCPALNLSVAGYLISPPPNWRFMHFLPYFFAGFDAWFYVQTVDSSGFITSVANPIKIV